MTMRYTEDRRKYLKRAARKRKLSPYERIELASLTQKGVRLSLAEVYELTEDDAILTAAENDSERYDDE